MSILSSNSIISKSLWILLMITVSLHPKQVVGMIDDGSYSSESDFGESEESLKADLGVSASSESLADFPPNRRHLKTHCREETPSNINLEIGPEHFNLPVDFPRLHHHSIQQTLNDSPNSMSKDEVRFLQVDEPVNDKPALKLSSRLSYVARQFYQYVWKRRNNPKKDVQGTVESEENPGKSQESEENTWGYGDDDDDDKEETEIPVDVFTTMSPNDVPHISWRNIIGAPVSSCPPGERKDSNGRCRKALW